MLAALPRLDPAALAGRTVDDWLDGAVGDPAARRLVHAVVRVATYCDAPDRLDAGAALAQVQRSLHGSVRYLDGGWQHLVDQLTASPPAAARPSAPMRRWHVCGGVRPAASRSTWPAG
jgi:phytoene dehydrogenase-like protein